MNKAERKVKESRSESYDLDRDDKDALSQFTSSHKLARKSEISLPSPTSSSPIDVSLSSPIKKTFQFSVTHNIKNVSTFSKTNICGVCESTGQGGSGHKCSECNIYFHPRCVCDSIQVPCMPVGYGNLADLGTSSVLKQPSRPPRSKGQRKGSKTSTSSKGQRSGSEGSAGYSRSGSSWNVTRTAEFTDPKDVLITDVRELHYMETFISKKINSMDDSKRNSSKESMVDVVFKNALKEFKTNLISTYSVASPDQMHISYKNIIDHFEQVMLCICQKENTWKSFPVTMGVNGKLTNCNCCTSLA